MSVKNFNPVRYDRDADTTFNTFEHEELVQIKTLLRHVGGAYVVGYELFKMENGYRDSSKVAVACKDENGNTTGEFVYKSIRQVWEESIKLRNSYKNKIHQILNPNNKVYSKANKDKHLIVKCINKLAKARENEKKKIILNGQSFIRSKNTINKDQIQEAEAVAIKNMTSDISAIPPADNGDFGFGGNGG